MKNKTKTYILLALVLGIWGTIGYKIITGLNPDAPEQVEDEINVSFTPEEIKKTDTFSIQTTERDPFLGTLTRSNKPRTNTTKTPKPIKEESVPQITYQGLVKKQNSSQQVFVVTVNGKQHLLKRGQSVDDVKLIKGNAKEIVVLNNHKQQTIALQ